MGIEVLLELLNGLFLNVAAWPGMLAPGAPVALDGCGLLGCQGWDFPLACGRDTFSERLSQFGERFTGLSGGLSYEDRIRMGHLGQVCRASLSTCVATAQ